MSYQTEEEQLAAIGRLWKKYGNLVLTVIVLIAAAVYGYRAWTNHENAKAEQASALFQQLTEMNSNMQPGQTLSKEQQASFEHIVSLLKKDYSSSVYAQFAELLLAKQAVLANQPEEAKKALQSVIDSAKDENLTSLATIRLATILMGEGKDNAEKALQSLQSIKKPEAFAIAREEAIGDAYVAINQIDHARTAYQKALDIAKEEKTLRPFIQIKLDNLAQTGGIK